MRAPLPLLSAAAAAAAVALVALLAGCQAPAPDPVSPPLPAPPAASGVQPAGTPVDVATGFSAPWSMVEVPAQGGDSTWLVSQRDDASVFLLVPQGDGYTARRLGTVPGVAPGGEGGLLGLAYLDDGETEWLYAYLTAASGNRIVRIAFGDEGAVTSEPEVVLDGIQKAGNHNGGRIAFGPDGMLYATTGDASQPALSQDPRSLNGKILRMTPTGERPDDNPIEGSLAYSLGHRNPQGLAWDDAGQLWAAEFGQNTWDELNRIEPGGNYGWPEVEGAGGSPGFIDPWAQWPTDQASPSGLTYVGGTFFLAALGGERLWAIYVDEEAQRADPVEWFPGEYGRIRDVAPGPGGSLWMMTNNTDGRGSPRDGDDRILEVRLTELQEG